MRYYQAGTGDVLGGFFQGFPAPTPTPTATPAQLPSPPYVPESLYGRGMRYFANEVRKGILPDEDLAAIKENPYGPQALMAYANAAIMLSRGAGGESPEGMPKGAVPFKTWKSWKQVGTAESGGQIVKDNAGNYFETLGSHQSTGEPPTSHVIVKPIENPQDVFEKIKDWKPPELDTQGAKDVANWKPYSQQEFQPTINDEHNATWHELGPNQQQWFLDQWKQGNKVTMQDMMDSLYGKGAGTEGGLDNPFYKFMTGKEPPPSIGDDFPEMPPGVTPEEYWSKYQKGQLPGQQGPPEQGPPSPTGKPDIGYKPPPGEEGPNLLTPGQKIWGNAFDRKYSGPLVGQTWADIYATPDVEFTVGGPSGVPKDMQDWLSGEPLFPEEPPPIDPKIQSDFDKIRRWQEKQDFLKNRFNWQPPPEGFQSGSADVGPDLSGAGLRPTTYGPGSPGATPADMREFTGNYGNSLTAGDVALPREVALRYGLRPGDHFRYSGRIYRYADTPSGSVGNVIDVYYPGTGGQVPPTIPNYELQPGYSDYASQDDSLFRNLLKGVYSVAGSVSRAGTNHMNEQPRYYQIGTGDVMGGYYQGMRNAMPTPTATPSYRGNAGGGTIYPMPTPRDNIPAMLSQHEAVLTPIAADIIGRDKIQQANEIANRMETGRNTMYMRPEYTRYYQFGTQNVMPPWAYRQRQQNLPPPPMMGMGMRYYAIGTDNVGQEPGAPRNQGNLDALGLNFPGRGPVPNWSIPQNPFSNPNYFPSNGPFNYPNIQYPVGGNQPDNSFNPNVNDFTGKAPYDPSTFSPQEPDPYGGRPDFVPQISFTNNALPGFGGPGGNWNLIGGGGGPFSPGFNTGPGGSTFGGFTSGTMGITGLGGFGPSLGGGKSPYDY